MVLPRKKKRAARDQFRVEKAPKGPLMNGGGDTQEDEDAQSVDPGAGRSHASSTSSDKDVDLHSTGHSGSNGTTTEQTERLNFANKQTQAVFRLRLMVFFVLFLAAICVSVIIYMVTSKGESDEYETQYESIAEKLQNSFLDIADTKFGVVSSLGVAVIAHGIDHKRTWPFVTLSSFQQRASTARRQSKALYVTINPLVNTSQREEWEHFAVSEDAKWM